ncbi:MAG: hypothetical protein AAFZ15_27310 [Bacteroidota bacterium]
MNAANNSFLKMQEEDELNFPVPPDIEENVFGSLQVLTMMGHAMEMFIPKAFEMFVLTLGGTIKEIDGIPSDELSSGDPSKDLDDIAPGIGGHAPDDEPI